MADRVVVIITLVIVAAFALAALAKPIKQLMKHLAVRKRLRTSRTTLADNTVVTLTGTVRLIGEPLIAPLSGTPCVLHLSGARLKKRRNLSRGMNGAASSPNIGAARW